jgi:fermentation-respiration switch protein FrsA (DUF1100 family)
LIFFVFLIFYLKYYEKKGIYFPTKDIEFTPSDIGLNYEDIYFLTEDNFKLNGWFIKAKNPKATLLYCHGNAGNISHRLEVIQILNKLNLNVFIFDYRGYGRSEGSPSEAGLYKDCEAAYDYLIKRDDISKEKIVAFGKSIGANVAIDLASKRNLAGLISYGGFTSAYDMGRRIFPFLPLFKWIVTVKYDAKDKIKDISTPKLIIHSIDDEIVPFELGKRLFEAAQKPKEFYQMRGGHNEAILMAKEEFSSKIDSFLKDILK